MAERKAAATKIEMSSLADIKPVTTRQSENSVEDGIDLEDDIQVVLSDSGLKNQQDLRKGMAATKTEFFNQYDMLQAERQLEKEHASELKQREKEQDRISA